MSVMIEPTRQALGPAAKSVQDYLHMEDIADPALLPIAEKIAGGQWLNFDDGMTPWNPKPPRHLSVIWRQCRTIFERQYATTGAAM